MGGGKNPFLIDSLTDVKDELKALFQTSVQTVQHEVQVNRRKQDNKLCSQKCNSTPTLFNFTESDIPPTLLSFLEAGLKNVPEIRMILGP